MIKAIKSPISENVIPFDGRPTIKQARSVFSLRVCEGQTGIEYFES